MASSVEKPRYVLKVNSATELASDDQSLITLVAANLLLKNKLPEFAIYGVKYAGHPQDKSVLLLGVLTEEATTVLQSHLAALCTEEASKRRKLAEKPLGPDSVQIYRTDQFININIIEIISGDEVVALSKSVTWAGQSPDYD